MGSRGGMWEARRLALSVFNLGKVPKEYYFQNVPKVSSKTFRKVYYFEKMGFMMFEFRPMTEIASHGGAVRGKWRIANCAAVCRI